ncbi:MAG TPA: type IV pilus twitching motility protein PilT [Vicinamibacteria bacterium]|nr:type IV pilus twitching motility protein PilT [Vicinamibacteria bacterium]
MSLDRLLQQAAKAGGQELRLLPGRRIVILTPAGEREVQGPPQTPASIEELLAPVLTEDSRKSLAAGTRAEWRMEVAGVGGVRALAELRPGSTRAVFSLDNAPRPSVPAAAPPRAKAGGTAAEMEELLTLLFEMKASDLHISVGSPPLVRHDGEIKPLPGRAVLTPADTESMLWPIAPERNRDEFKRRSDTDFAYEIAGVARYRCNFFRDRKGMGGVFRVIPTQIITAEEMGLSREILQLCHLPKGLVLVTGPTGSGKSTTLCALIDYINRTRTDHIITIEDPLEFVHENKKCLINQRQVGDHTASFKDALRAALREDPDIVLVGEMRDLETVAIAIETAETGHLVFGTLHTSSAPSTVDRIIDQFPADRQAQIRVMLAESLKGVISQMLCKKIGGGRVPVLEVLIGIPSVSNLIREAKIFQIPSIMQTGKKYGMCLMNESFTDLVKRKIVEPQEAYAKTLDKTGLLSSFRKNAIDTSWAPSEPATGAAPHA